MVKIRFAVVLPGDRYSDENLKLTTQLDCTDVIGHGPQTDVWDYKSLVKMKRQCEKFGLRLEVFEHAPRTDKIMLGLPGREEQLENFCKSLENLGAAGIRVIKPDQGAPVMGGWDIGSVTVPTRGGATSRVFDFDHIKDAPLTKYGVYREEQVWENLTFFLNGVVPTAEEAGIKLSFHPNDPPISPIKGFPRILRSIEAFDRMLEIYPSDNVGLLFCQGCFAEMGVDVPSAIRHFGKRKKIFYSHFRNVKGSVPKFQEIFHDDPEGLIDMFEAMKAYYEVGFEGPIRPDHAPMMEGDERLGGRMGYYVLGKVFGIGYMKGLAESIEKTGY
ncbi:MAG: mannonate dehydratase [Promethearchaeota archaeon]|jgi:mannonate dehydratase